MFLKNNSIWSKVVFTFLVAGVLVMSLTPFASAARSSNDVKKVQQALVDKGYNPGPVDGVMGSQTRHAIAQYQKAEDLPVTQHLDAKTADRLGVPQESVGGTFKDAGHDYAKGGKQFGHDIKNGRPIEAGKDLGKGVGSGGKETGEGVAKAVTP